MLIAAICEKMGWDYFTYCAQPHWFIHLLARKFEVDAQNAERQQ
jgi:hypothetical protein